MIDQLAEGETYASVMKRVTAIDLNPLGVTVKGAKRSKAGGIIIEVDGKDDADRLTEEIREVVGAAAAVRRPTRSTPILILDVPNWIEEAEVISHLVNFDSSFGDCQIRISDNQGSRTVFCRIPMKIASKVTDAGRIRIGWAMCRVKLLERKDKVSYKCQGTGHVAAACNSEAKPKACFTCKSLEHLARKCVAPPRGKIKPTRMAQDLLDQYMVERKVDVALISDPYRVDGSSSVWYADNGLKRLAIYIPGGCVTIGNVVCDVEFMAVRVNGVQVYSCYSSPNRPLDHFHNFLQRLEGSIRAILLSISVLVTGDFNARSAAWGDWVDNQRGEDLSALLDSLGLVIANEGSTPTFTRGAGSIVDTSSIRSGRLENVKQDRRRPLHCGLLAAEWLEGRREAFDAETDAERIEARITSAYDFAIPRRRTLIPEKPPVHWWTTEISQLRSNCVRAKRSRTRMISRIARVRGNATVGFDNDRAEAELERTHDAFREAKNNSRTPS
ncbi:hypothetical protein QTP88_010411 [Uroleucon formosanum]